LLSPGTVLIKDRAGVAMAPCIKQQVARPGIVPTNTAQSVEPGDITDTAQIDDRSGPARYIKKRGMEGGNERGALAACRNVSRPKVGYDVNSRVLGKAGRGE
jgi:hypothetical protein